ncbi:hypothetical protein NMG60_11014851 [Bertholletia excelsa]
MATTLQRPSSNTVADCEADSLSFTDLVCIKDQNQPTPQKGHPLPLPLPLLPLNPVLPPTSLESLFGQAKSTFSSAPGSPNHLFPWAILSPQNGSRAASQPGPKVSWAPVRSSSSRSSNSSSRSNGNELGLNKAAKETNRKANMGKIRRKETTSLSVRKYSSPFLPHAEAAVPLKLVNLLKYKCCDNKA